MKFTTRLLSYSPAVHIILASVLVCVACTDSPQAKKTSSTTATSSESSSVTQKTSSDVSDTHSIDSSHTSMEPELDSISPNTVLPQYTKAVIINTYPHDVQAFTQGLLLHEGKLLESTGQYGQSSLRRVDITSGRVEQKTRLQAHLFGEGITLLNGKIYMITWQSERGFVFEPKNLMQIGEFYYKGEGWGLTDDGTHLILSNGTNILQFLDPNTFKVVRQVSVFDKSNPVMQLNELEYINGEIFANIWMSDMIVRINPETGEIVGWVDASELFPQRNSQADVLNGIAFNKETETFYLTGKNWSKLFEVRLEEKIQ